jgi:hypothetical protein
MLPGQTEKPVFYPIHGPELQGEICAEKDRCPMSDVLCPKKAGSCRCAPRGDILSFIGKGKITGTITGVPVLPLRPLSSIG